MNNQKQFAVLDLGLILDDSADRYTNAGQRGAESADSAYHRGTLEASHNTGHDRPGNQQRPNQRYPEEAGSKQQASEATPEGPFFPLVQHAIAGVVVPDDMFLRMETLADERQLLHIEAVLLKITDGGFSLLVRSKNRDDRVRV
jgi:hypothetical protein